MTQSGNQNNGNTLKKWDASDKQDFENHILSILISLLQLDPVIGKQFG